MKKVYLTIDDSPGTQFTAKVDLLLKHHIPAVFFCIGQLIEKYPDAVIDSIHKGFIVANHSYTHPAFSKITLKQAEAEIQKTDQIIEEIYQAADVPRPAKWFRFPYGDKGDLRNGKVFSIFRKGDSKRKAAIQELLRNLDYQQPPFGGVTYRYMQKAKLWEDADWAWTFDVMEWAMEMDKPLQGLHNLDKVFQRLATKNPRDCRGFLGLEKRWLSSPSDEVLLLHDHEATNEDFATIIEYLLTLPFSFASFDDFIQVEA